MYKLTYIAEYFYRLKCLIKNETITIWQKCDLMSFLDLLLLQLHIFHLIYRCLYTKL